MKSNIPPLVLCTAALFLLASCATSPTVSEQSSFALHPQAGNGIVIFYREGQFGGGATWFGIRDGSLPIGRLSNGTYFAYHAVPGTHHFSASSEASDSKSISIESGKTYYVRCGVASGIFLARPRLMLVDPQEGASAIRHLRPSRS